MFIRRAYICRMFTAFVDLVILWQPLCDLNVVKTTACFKAIMEVYGGKNLQVWAHKVLSVRSYGGIR